MKKNLILFIGLISIIGILSSCAKHTSPSLVVTPVDTVQQKGTSPFPMPLGDLAGWKQVTAEDFLTTASSDQFSATYANSWSSYDDGGKYYKSAISAGNGMMNIKLNGLTGAAGVFGPPDTRMGYMYGRYSICFKAVGASGNGTAIMVWPSSNVWGDGEIDYPEGNFEDTLHVFHHGVGCTQCYAADSYNTGVSWRDWHVTTTEWTPASVKYYLDGVLIKKVTHDIPINNHRFTIQMAPNATNSLVGNFYIDWVAVYYPFPAYSDPAVGITQDNTSNIFAYTVGNWVTANNSNHYSGSEKETNSLNGTVEYTFTGTRAELYSYFGPWSGKCDVYVDNVLKVTVDQYSSTDAFQQLVYNTGTLPDGTHQIRLVNIGQKNASSGGTNIGVDKAVYYQ